MAGGVGFIRVKLLQVEKGSSMDSVAPMFDPYVAVNVKESVQTPGNETSQNKSRNWVVLLICCSLPQSKSHRKSQYKSPGNETSQN